MKFVVYAFMKFVYAVFLSKRIVLNLLKNGSPATPLHVPMLIF